MKTAVRRLVSLDAFRGAVILTMIFVNTVSGMPGLPGWMEHARSEADTFTFVDVVFPAFLFIVGVALPLAIASRRARGAATASLVWHILLRAGGLLVLGVVMVNGEHYSAEATGMRQAVWNALAWCAVIIIWNAPSPAWPVSRREWYNGARVLAGAVFLCLLFSWRGKTAAGEIVHLQHSWWGILGLIGWAYLACSLLYLAVAGEATALMGLMAFMFALYIGDQHGRLEWLGPIRSWVSVGENFGTLAGVVMAGVVVGRRLIDPGSAASRARFMLGFGLVLLLAGFLLRPLHGFHKNSSTESWGLATAGITCLLFMAFYLVLDVWKWPLRAGLLRPAGQNPLLAYLLPEALGSVFVLISFDPMMYYGRGPVIGCLNAAAYTLGILLLTGFLTRRGVILKL